MSHYIYVYHNMLLHKMKGKYYDLLKVFPLKKNGSV